VRDGVLADSARRVLEELEAEKPRVRFTGAG
jgi:hypothetical protein